MKKKKLYLNKRGEILANIILLIALFFGAVDSENMIAFISSKIIAMILLFILFILSHYIKEN